MDGEALLSRLTALTDTVHDTAAAAAILLAYGSCPILRHTMTTDAFRASLSRTHHGSGTIDSFVRAA